MSGVADSRMGNEGVDKQSVQERHKSRPMKRLLCAVAAVTLLVGLGAAYYYRQEILSRLLPGPQDHADLDPVNPGTGPDDQSQSSDPKVVPQSVDLPTIQTKLRFVGETVARHKIFVAVSVVLIALLVASVVTFGVLYKQRLDHQELAAMEETERQRLDWLKKTEAEAEAERIAKEAEDARLADEQNEEKKAVVNTIRWVFGVVLAVFVAVLVVVVCMHAYKGAKCPTLKLGKNPKGKVTMKTGDNIEEDDDEEESEHDSDYYTTYKL